MTTAERVCGSYTATTVTLVRYLTCMRRPGRPFSARPVLFASSCAGARVRLGPAAAPGGIRIMINHRALAWSGEVPLRAHFDTIACLASVLKFARCSPFRFWKNYIKSYWYSFHLYHGFSMASSLPLVRPRVSAI